MESAEPHKKPKNICTFILLVPMVTRTKSILCTLKLKFPKTLRVGSNRVGGALIRAYKKIQSQIKHMPECVK